MPLYRAVNMRAARRESIGWSALLVRRHCISSSIPRSTRLATAHKGRYRSICQVIVVTVIIKNEIFLSISALNIDIYTIHKQKYINKYALLIFIIKVLKLLNLEITISYYSHLRYL